MTGIYYLATYRFVAVWPKTGESRRAYVRRVRSARIRHRKLMRDVSRRLQAKGVRPVVKVVFAPERGTVLAHYRGYQARGKL